MECVNSPFGKIFPKKSVPAQVQFWFHVENDSKILNVLYIVADDIYINDITNEIIKFCLGNNIFNLVEYKNNELVFVSNDFVNVKVCYVKELSVDITNKIVFNPYNLSISNEQLSYSTLIYSMNSIIVELGKYLIYKKAKDNPFMIAFALCIVGYACHNIFCYQQVCCTPFLFITLGIGESLTKSENFNTIK